MDHMTRYEQYPEVSPANVDDGWYWLVRGNAYTIVHVRIVGQPFGYTVYNGSKSYGELEEEPVVSNRPHRRWFGPIPHPDFEIYK